MMTSPEVGCNRVTVVMPSSLTGCNRHDVTSKVVMQMTRRLKNLYCNDDVISDD